MSTEKQLPVNILAALESKKGSLAAIVKGSWEGTKRNDMNPVAHFCAFQFNLMRLLQMDASMVFNVTLGLLADYLLPLLTEEEKEALRNESTNLGK